MAREIAGVFGVGGSDRRATQIYGSSVFRHAGWRVSERLDIDRGGGASDLVWRMYASCVLIGSALQSSARCMSINSVRLTRSPRTSDVAEQQCAAIFAGSKLRFAHVVPASNGSDRETTAHSRRGRRARVCRGPPRDRWQPRPEEAGDHHRFEGHRLTRNRSPLSCCYDADRRLNWCDATTRHSCDLAASLCKDGLNRIAEVDVLRLGRALPESKTTESRKIPGAAR